MGARFADGTPGAWPTSSWLVGGAGVLLGVLALTLTAWSKGLVKDTLRYGCTEFGARQQVLTADLLDRLQRKAGSGLLGGVDPLGDPREEVPAEVAACWTYEAGELVARHPADAPEPPGAFAQLVSQLSEASAAIQAEVLRGASWTPSLDRRLKEARERGPTGTLVEWDLPVLAESISRRLAAESDERYVAELLTRADMEPSFRSQAELALPEPISTWTVAVGLRDPEAERTAVRLQTFALGALVVWLLGVLGWGLWRGSQRQRAERELRLQREQLLVRTTHELQTPLALLRAACESIRNGAVEGADRERALGIVVREEARLTEAIRRLLRHLRLENAPRELAPVSRVVREAPPPPPPTLAAHGLELELELDASAEGLSAPAEFVADLVRELCANARKHASGARRLRVSLAARGTTVRLRYADDGPGFASTGVGTGGLGVLLLQDGLSRLGGTLTRGASPQGGAQVEVSLPCQRTPTPS